MKLVMSLQSVYFKKEIKIYNISPSNNQARSKDVLPKSIKKISKLHRLDPFVGEQILRVGGRLKKATFPYELRNPIIIPKESIIAQRIAEEFHKRTKHCGRTTTINEIRQHGYWIVNANSIVRSIVNRCVQCRSMRGKLENQKMADLPEERFSTCLLYTSPSPRDVSLSRMPSSA